jgi:lipopolysaccharide export system permease protein
MSSAGESVLSLIDRWLLKEVAKTLLVILAVLLMVLLASNLVKFLGLVASGAIGGNVLLALVGLELLKTLGMLVPPAFFFAVLWVLGRLYRDGEMLALQAAGVGTLRIYRAFLYSALPLALLVAWLMLVVLPWAKLAYETIRITERDRTELAAVRPGEFNEFARGDLVVFAEGTSPDGELRGLFVQDRMQGTPAVVVASGARQQTDPATGARYIVLLNGKRYEGLDGKQPLSVGQFGEYAFRIPAVPLDLSHLPLSARTLQQLVDSDNPRYQAELQYRLTLPLAVLAFTLVAVPLARSVPRQGIYGRLGVAVLTYFVFMNLQRLGERWLVEGVTPGWLGMWWVPALLALLALGVLAYDAPAWRVWLRRRRGEA